MSKDQNPSDKACDAYFDNPYAATSGSYYSDRVTFYAGFAAGAASRDAEVVSLTNQRDYEYVRAENAEHERDQLRAELAAALAACKAKDEAILQENYSLALSFQPDDSALKAWLGAPVAWEFTDAFGTHYTDDQRDWMDTPGIESVTSLYSPKELK